MNQSGHQPAWWLALGLSRTFFPRNFKFLRKSYLAKVFQVIDGVLVFRVSAVIFHVGEEFNEVCSLLARESIHQRRKRLCILAGVRRSRVLQIRWGIRLLLCILA